MFSRFVAIVALLAAFGCGTGPAPQPASDQPLPTGEEVSREAGEATGETEILYNSSHDVDEAPAPQEERLGEELEVDPDVDIETDDEEVNEDPSEDGPAEEEPDEEEPAEQEPSEGDPAEGDPAEEEPAEEEPAEE